MHGVFKSPEAIKKLLKKAGLKPKMLVSAHSPNPGSMQDLEQALTTELYQASR